jgi:putative serine/threonine protein kinase
LSDFISLDEALDSKVGKFLCWPVFNLETAEERVSQLRGLGVESVALGGPHAVLDYPILGKGHVGVVIRAMYKGREVALKCRRTDADKTTMDNEARLLRKANEAGVGPLVYIYSRDFIVMEKLVGPYFGDWVRENIDKTDEIRKNVFSIIGIARKLDVERIDHGELTKIRRHYIITEDGPRVIDFESSSLGRTPQNITCTVQSMFLQTRFAKVLAQAYPMPDRDELLKALRRYKKNPDEENYREVLRAINLI